MVISQWRVAQNYRWIRLTLFSCGQTLQTFFVYNFAPNLHQILVSHLLIFLGAKVLNYPVHFCLTMISIKYENIQKLLFTALENIQWNNCIEYEKWLIKPMSLIIFKKLKISFIRWRETSESDDPWEDATSCEEACVQRCRGVNDNDMWKFGIRCSCDRRSWPNRCVGTCFLSIRVGPIHTAIVKHSVICALFL